MAVAVRGDWRSGHALRGTAGAVVCIRFLFDARVRADIDIFASRFGQKSFRSKPRVDVGGRLQLSDILFVPLDGPSEEWQAKLLLLGQNRITASFVVIRGTAGAVVCIRFLFAARGTP